MNDHTEPSREGVGAEAGASAPAPPPPSLVIYGHSSAQSSRAPWTRQQKRVFNRLTSWCFEAVGRDAQLLRVDLTTAPGGQAKLLGRHLQELRRRVERKFKYKGVEVFKIETTEGNGVLHMVWAWVGRRTFYVPQPWLSETWERIHGAPIVYVRKMDLARTSIKRVGRYFALQYLADQRGALVRMSWSWKRARVSLARGWQTLKRFGSLQFRDGWQKRRCEPWVDRHGDVQSSASYPSWRSEPMVSMSELVVAWEELLSTGSATLGEILLEIRSREVVEVF